MGAKNKISGIICEFNPLHNGHAALLRHVRQTMGGPIVCVMSGNFVQRGEAAALDKWSRTRLALQNGADLVIELPLPWAMAGAERFALGGVSLLHALGCVDTLAFGSESGDAAALMSVAKFLRTPAFPAQVKPYLAQGDSFAIARSKAIAAALGADAADLNGQPNNILGIEYCKAILGTGAPLQPYTVRRFHVDHDSQNTSGQFASASLLRGMSAKNEDISPFVPSDTADVIRTLQADGRYPASLQYLERGILGFLSACPPAQLQNVPDVAEGIENRVLAAAGQVSTLSELYDAVKTKRYSHARIRRIVLSTYLGLTKDLPETPPYIRVLGMNENGTEILRAAHPTLPLVMRPANVRTLTAAGQRVFELEARADDLYALCTENRRPAKMDYTKKLIRL